MFNQINFKLKRDRDRPCRRCVRLGRAHLCSDVPPRKRSRTDGSAGDGGETDCSVDLHPHRGAEEEAKPNRKRNRTKKNKKDFNVNVNNTHTDNGTTTSAALVVDPPQLAAIEQKFDLVTQLLHTMAGEMKQMRHTHDALFVELRQTQDQLRGTDAVVAELLRREQKRADDKQRRSAEEERKKQAQTQTQMSVSLSTTTSSSSPISSPSSVLGLGPRSSFSFELSLLQSGVSPAVVLEARQQLPWMCHYDISPNRFAILDFAYVCQVTLRLCPSPISRLPCAVCRVPCAVCRVPCAEIVQPSGVRVGEDVESGGALAFVVCQ
jgi:hypothetical protein